MGVVRPSLVPQTDGALRTLSDVDATMGRIGDQREIANEIAEAISAPTDQTDEVICHPRTSTTGIHDTPQDALREELAELEQEQLDERLAGAEHVPVHIPSGAREARECREVSLFMNRPFIFFIVSDSQTNCGGGRRGSAVERVAGLFGDVVPAVMLYYTLNLTPVCADTMFRHLLLQYIPSPSFNNITHVVLIVDLGAYVF